MSNRSVQTARIADREDRVATRHLSIRAENVAVDRLRDCGAAKLQQPHVGRLVVGDDRGDECGRSDALEALVTLLLQLQIGVDLALDLIDDAVVVGLFLFFDRDVVGQAMVGGQDELVLLRDQRPGAKPLRVTDRAGLDDEVRRVDIGVHVLPFGARRSDGDRQREREDAQAHESAPRQARI